MPNSDPTILEWARAYAAAGLRVFPVNGITQGVCTCGKPDCDRPGKHPRTTHGVHDATTDVNQLVAWFGNGNPSHFNIAVATGNGLAAIDVDVRHNGLETLDSWCEWVQGTWTPPATRRQRTGSGGLHLVYKVPLDARVKTRDAVLPGIDVKGDGGYIIVAPSLHISGGFYHWENIAHPIVSSTPELLAWFITARGGRFRQGAGGETPDGYDFTAGATAGQRDAFFNDLAFRLRKSGCSYERAFKRMRDEWERCDQPESDPYPWELALEKLVRNWRDIEPDPVLDNRLAWAQAQGRRQVTTSEPEIVANTPDPTPVSGAPVSGVPMSGPPGSAPPHGPVRVVEEWDPTEHLTDMGNGRRFVRLFGKRVRYCKSDRQWYIWDGVRFCPDRVDEVMRLTQGVIADIRDQAAAAPNNEERDRLAAHALRTESTTARDKLLRSAGVEQEISVSVEQLDADPAVLVVKNGVIDLRTCEMREASPDDLCTKQAAVTYDPGAECPLWLKHIEFVTRRKDGTPDPALAAHLQRWAGYTLTGWVTEQKFLFAFGDGDNGKNVLIETLLEMLGTYGMRGSAQILTGTGREHETIIADLAGARMVFVDETPQGKVNETRLKTLTGSSKLRARHIGKDTFEFNARFKLWIAGNNKPRIGDTSVGFWRRLDLVPFDMKITNKIPGYIDILREEWPGILNWCLDGLRSYLDVGSLAQPDRVMQAGAEYQEDENAFHQFVDEYFIIGSEPQWTPNNALHWAYTQWCQANGEKNVLSMRMLANDWRKSGFVRDTSTRRIKQGWPDAKDSVQRGWLGPVLRILPLPLRWENMYTLTDAGSTDNL